MGKKVFMFAAASCAASVILGALAAHSLEPKLDDKLLAAFKTAAHYQFIHSVALIALLAAENQFKTLNFKQVYNSLIMGILLFSGSLYLLAMKDLWGLEWLGKLGIVTPFGGGLFIAGWALLLLQVRKNFPTNQEK